jgi:hypothetical protein
MEPNRCPRCDSLDTTHYYEMDAGERYCNKCGEVYAPGGFIFYADHPHGTDHYEGSWSGQFPRWLDLPKWGQLYLKTRVRDGMAIYRNNTGDFLYVAEYSGGETFGVCTAQQWEYVSGEVVV